MGFSDQDLIVVGETSTRAGEKPGKEEQTAGLNGGWLGLSPPKPSDFPAGFCSTASTRIQASKGRYLHSLVGKLARFLPCSSTTAG